MIKWVDIDNPQYARSITEGRPDRPPLESGASIYEIPSRIGIAAEPSAPFQLSVFFEYISSEPSLETVTRDGVKIVRGLHSGRLKKATVDVSHLFKGKRPSPTEIADHVSRAIIPHIVSSAANTTLGERRSALTGRIIRDHSGNFILRSDNLSATTR